MSSKCSTAAMVLVCTAAISIWAIGSRNAAAQDAHAGHDHGAHAGHSEGSSMRAGGMPMNHRSSHGGQMTVVGPICFEVVYQPMETRVYLYGSDDQHQPIAAQGVQGQLVMKMHGNDKAYPFPLKYVALKPGSAGQDYLAAAVDVSKIRDGSMNVTFELAGLPNPQGPRAAFTQAFALSKPAITMAALNESDRAGIDRQKVCPVTGGKLGSMGTPIKMLVGNRPVYLCCKGCPAKFQANPEAYLQKLAPAGAPAGQIIATQATAADEAAIALQRLCPSTGGKLGSMGAPIKVTAGGQSLFVCCKGCVGKVKNDPNTYFAKAAELRTGR